MGKWFEVFSGWRGRLGRAIPDPILRKYLQSQHVAPDSGNVRPRISDQRLENLERTVQLAQQLGLSFNFDSNSSMHCISQKDWENFKRALEREGFGLAPVKHYSFAASAAWSITRSNEPAQLGSGALWQVFPGPIEPNTDAQDFVGAIDVVYTWVDSQDPQWAGAYKDVLRDQGKAAERSAIDMARYTSRDELLYSLRSLETYLPWVNHIYLVTAGQRPSWLAEAHPKLTVIDHSQIFDDPKRCLPTFNSHAIESQLLNISNLKEHFIYVNDDVFFGRHLSPNVFFGPAGQAKYCLAKGHFAAAEEPNLPVNRAARNNRELVVEKFGRTTSRKFQHVAHPQRKEVHQQIHADYPERVAQVAAQRFRADTDLSIPSSLAHQYAARLGLGFPTKVAYQYVDIGSENFYLDMLRLRKNRTVDMFCINEVMTVADTNRSGIVVETLAGMFPIKSSFER